MERKRVSVYCGEERIFSVKRNHLLPAEMEKIQMKSFFLQKIDQDIWLRVEDE
jgi:hypothetical protein